MCVCVCALNSHRLDSHMPSHKPGIKHTHTHTHTHTHWAEVFRQILWPVSVFDARHIFQAFSWLSFKLITLMKHLGSLFKGTAAGHTHTHTHTHTPSLIAPNSDWAESSQVLVRLKVVTFWVTTAVCFSHKTERRQFVKAKSQQASHQSDKPVCAFHNFLLINQFPNEKSVFSTVVSWVWVFQQQLTLNAPQSV